MSPQHRDRPRLHVVGSGLLGVVALLALLSPSGCAGEAPPSAPSPAVAAPSAPPVAAPAVQAPPALAGASGLTAIADAAERVVPAVVNISSTRVRRFAPSGGSPFDLFSHPRVPQERREQSRGSGVIVSADGVVLTNHHVVAGADEVMVTLHDGRELEAEVVGSDERSDVGVLRLKEGAGAPKDLPVLPVGDSDALRLGEVVLAVGNPFGLGSSVSMGIVSAMGRSGMGIVDYEDFIQTDAAINPGNSGGALVNLRGELVGINTAIVSRSGGSQGIGFAIPSEIAADLMRRILDDGRVVRGWLGVSIQDLDPAMAGAFKVPQDTRGALIAGVMPSSPAADGGLEQGDIVTRLDGEPVEGADALRTRVGLSEAGRTVRLELLRDGRSQEVAVTLGERPEDVAVVEADDPDAPALIAGVTLGTVDAEAQRSFDLPRGLRRGALVREVAGGSPGERSGLRPGDVIVEVNRRPVGGPGEVAAAVGSGQALLRVVRGEGSLYLVLKD